MNKNASATSERYSNYVLKCVLTCSDQSAHKMSYIVIAYQRFKLKFAIACNNYANYKNEYPSFALCQRLNRRLVKMHVLRMRN